MDSRHYLHAGDARALIAEDGAALLGLQVRGVSLVHGADSPTEMAAGIVLAPWPNRVDGGTWLLDGNLQQLELTEPDLGNAIHGLLSRTRYTAVRSNGEAVRLEARIDAPAGYPFVLETAVEYHLASDGVLVRHEIVNAGERTAPFAVGAHPYLGIGRAPSRDLEIRIRAGAVVDLDDRCIPRGISDVAEPSTDLREWTPLDDVIRHGCFAAIELSDGLIRHGLRHRTGIEVELWADPSFAYAQIFATDALKGLGAGELAVAIEPMTAPPNALRSGLGLRWLAPGEGWAGSWGIRLATGGGSTVGQAPKCRLV